MAGALRQWLDGTRDALLWLEYTAYARRVFGGGDDFWSNPQAIASTLGQAQGLLKSDVVGVDGGGLFAPAQSADDPLAAVAEALGPERLANAREALQALAYQVSGEADLVLALPSPAALLRLAGADDEAARDFGNLDDTGAALCDVLRGLSETALDGVVIVCEDTAGFDADESDALGPVLAVLDHHGWCAGTCHTLATEAPDALGDFTLLPAAPVATIAAAGARFGGGLDAAFWAGGEAPALGLRYGAIPADAVPETVLTQVARLRG